MNTRQPSTPPRLTSVSVVPQNQTAVPLPEALQRALMQQRCSLFGAERRAESLRHATTSQHAQQLALAEELQRLATEAFNLADHLEAVGA